MLLAWTNKISGKTFLLLYSFVIYMIHVVYHLFILHGEIKKKSSVIYIFINFDFSKKYIKFLNLLVFIYNDIVLSHVALTDNLL